MTEKRPLDESARTSIVGRLWRSVFAGPVLPKNDRERKWVTFNHFILHFRPVRVPAATLRYTHTFGLGGMSLLLVLLLMGTGVLLMFVYEPSPEAAYESVRRLQEATLFGSFVRGVHHWSANLLIVVVALHLLRVFFTGAMHPPRQFNWVIGLGLLALVVGSNFTGYLLPWDQLAYWAITISTAMIGYVPLLGVALQRAIQGGETVGQATLIIFYALHTTVLPVLIVTLMGFHFWRVRKAKGVVVPRAPGEAPETQPEKVLGLPHLFLREFVVGLILMAVIFMFSALVAAPLGEAANPGMSPNPAKAPWYFMGLQETLLHFHPLIAVVVLPLSGVVGLVAVAYLEYDDDPSGIWFVSLPGRAFAKAAAVAGAVGTILLVVLDEWVVDLPELLPWLPPVVSNGVLPVGMLTAGLWLGYRWLRTKRSATRNEATQAVFVFLGTALLVLTVVGVWFRGPGMTLTWAG